MVWSAASHWLGKLACHSKFESPSLLKVLALAKSKNSYFIRIFFCILWWTTLLAASMLWMQTCLYIRDSERDRNLLHNIFKNIHAWPKLRSSGADSDELKCHVIKLLLVPFRTKHELFACTGICRLEQGNTLSEASDCGERSEPQPE